MEPVDEHKSIVTFHSTYSHDCHVAQIRVEEVVFEDGDTGRMLDARSAKGFLVTAVQLRTHNCLKMRIDPVETVIRIVKRKMARYAVVIIAGMQGASICAVRSCALDSGATKVAPVDSTKRKERKISYLGHSLRREAAHLGFSKGFTTIPLTLLKLSETMTFLSFVVKSYTSMVFVSLSAK